MSQPLYSDRTLGEPEPTAEKLPATTARALLAYANQRADGHWLAHAYPEQCPDGNGICGTDRAAWETRRDALIPRLTPGWGEDLPNDAIFDLLELMGRDIAKPTQSSFHSYFRHWEYTFDRTAGAREFRDDVNEYLTRAGVMYRMRKDMVIKRLGPPEVQATVADLTTAAGDDTVDALLQQARTLYGSRNQQDRAQAVEKLWDAFERLKTLDGPDKKNSVATMLARFEPAPWRQIVEDEMTALTKIGNNFQIRHFESNKVPVPPEATDYLIARMGALVNLLRDSRTAP